MFTGFSWRWIHKISFFSHHWSPAVCCLLSLPHYAVWEPWASLAPVWCWKGEERKFLVHFESERKLLLLMSKNVIEIAAQFTSVVIHIVHKCTTCPVSVSYPAKCLTGNIWIYLNSSNHLLLIFFCPFRVDGYWLEVCRPTTLPSVRWPWRCLKIGWICLV